MESTSDPQQEKTLHTQESDLSQQSGASHKRTVGKRLKEGTAHTVQGEEKIGVDLKF